MREKINDETLSLRKNKHKKDLFSRRNFFLNNKTRHLICPLKLKGIPDQMLEKFRINDNDLVNTIEKALEYLKSKELDQIKFGAFLFRRYFCVKAMEEEDLAKENKRLDFYVDIFIEKGVIEAIGKVLLTESNADILSELLWTLLNISYYNTKVKENNYIKCIINNQVYMDIFFKIINNGDNEIMNNLFDFLTNCIIDSDDFAKYLFSNEQFMRLCLMKYLEPAKSVKIELDVKKSMSYFFVSLSKLSDVFNEKQKNTFYKIYEKLIGIRQFEPDIIRHAIMGLRFLFCNESPEQKIVFNIIKKYNYDIFDKLFLSLKEIIAKNQNYDSIDEIIYNITKIVKNFIALSEEKDIIILLQNTDLLNFIEAFSNQIYLLNIRVGLLEIILQLSHHTPNVVLNMIKGRDKLVSELIKGTLNSNSFEIKMKGILIIYDMLSLNSLDINIILFKNGIIEQIIAVNLLNEMDNDCLTKILNCILLFINSLNPLENQWKVEIINNLLKIGITNGLDNNNVRFNEEHNIIINQIKTDIKTILNYDFNDIPNNNINDYGIMSNQNQNGINANNSNRPL